MLRYNMERSAGQALDTLGDSRRVRELLSVHNIGQRLFAKWDQDIHNIFNIHNIGQRLFAKWDIDIQDTHNILP